MSNNILADSCLLAAKTKFTAYQNTEGLIWVNSSETQWKKANKVQVGVQNGHIFSYLIAQSPNPRYFATGGKDNLVKVWDLNLGKEIVTLNEHRDEINALCYSANGRYLATASADSTICIWNAYNFSLLRKFKTAKPELAIRFSPDSKSIVSAGLDSSIKIRDIQTGKIQSILKLHKGIITDIYFHPQFDNILFSAGTDSLVYRWEIDTKSMTRWFKHGGRALSVKLSNDGNFMSVVSTDSVITVWNTETNKKLFTGSIKTFPSGTRTYYASETFTPDSKYIIFPSAKDSFLIVKLSNLQQRIYPTGLDNYNLADVVFSNDGHSMFARFDRGGPLRIYNFAGWDMEKNTTISWKDIRQYANLPVGVQFTKDDKGLIVLSSDIMKIDLTNGNSTHLYYGGSTIENRSIVLNDETKGTYFESNRPVLKIYDHTKQKDVANFALPLTETLTAYTISKNDTYSFLGAQSGIIGAWNLATQQPLFLNKYGNRAIIKLHFDTTKQTLVAINKTGNVFFIQPNTGKVVDSLFIPQANEIAIGKQFLYISTANGFLYKYDAHSLKQIKKNQLNITAEETGQMILSADEKYLYIQNSFYTIMALNTKTDLPLFTIQDHNYGGTMLSLSYDGKLLASAGMDSKLHLFDALTGKRKVSIYLPLDKQVLIADEDGHYLASKNTLEAILFTYNNNAYGFDQFDLQYNRPDIVLNTIGRADTSLIKSYYAAYKKRLSKLNIEENASAAEVHLPLVRLKDKYDLQTITTEQQFDLNIECYDSRFPIQSLQVIVNNTPLLGLNGKDMSGLKSKSIVQKITVPLSTENNSIKVYCTNSQGVTSLKESFEVFSKYKPTQPVKNYFIGIGISHYTDSNMNLRYAAKDVRDLAIMFDRFYNNLTIDTLIDENATRENILAIKEKLKQSTVNDRIILAVTGHGLLSDSLDFYYATYDVDFKHPEKRGLKYEWLEDLLSDIPARKKLMLIDACHS
ncbi:MAG: caspase family protein, partial [Ferruginibacter sp.]